MSLLWLLILLCATLAAFTWWMFEQRIGHIDQQIEIHQNFKQ